MLSQLIIGSYGTSSVPVTGGSRWDPAYVSSPLSLSNLNKRLTEAAGTSVLVKSVPTEGNGKSSGKWYFEVLLDQISETSSTTSGVGVATSDFAFSSANIGSGTSGKLAAGMWGDGSSSNNRIYSAGSYATSSGISEMSTGVVVMVAMDIDARLIWFGTNGTWSGGGNPAAGTGASVGSANLAASKTWLPTCTPYTADAGQDNRFDINSGSSECAYAAPAGFGYW